VWSGPLKTSRFRQNAQCWCLVVGRVYGQASASAENLAMSCTQPPASGRSAAVRGSSRREVDLERGRLQVSAAGKRFAEKMRAAGISPDEHTFWAGKQRWDFLRPKKRLMPPESGSFWSVVTASSRPLEWVSIYVAPDGSVTYENERGERKPYDGRGLPAEEIVDLLDKYLERHGA
jgi:hypothetical protein